MISIQTAMLIGLGFLIASLLAVLLTPAYRARTVRLTSERIRAQLPTTEQELKADKDRIRAENALRLHKLETQLERFKFGAARQLVEVSRRDGQINLLSGTLEETKSELEIALNARNVLEQTIADRLPKVEQRLVEAKKLLFQRDREIASLSEDSARTQRALVEAVQINAQQRSEIERLTMVISTRAMPNRDGLADPTFDAELALRAELEALRSRSRDQSSMLERLHSNGAGNAAIGSAIDPTSYDPAGVPEVVRLQRDLVRAETALKSLKDVASAGQLEQSRVDAELRQREQRLEDQAQQIAGLAAALRAYEEDAAGERQGGSIKDSKIAMKSRLSALQAETAAQGEVIRKLRSEVAASNERLARQAQHFMEEMRRLGAGTLPASAQARRPAAAAIRRSLTQRITEAKPETASAFNGSKRPVLVKSDNIAVPQITSEASNANSEPAIRVVVPDSRAGEPDLAVVKSDDLPPVETKDELPKADEDKAGKPANGEPSAMPAASTASTNVVAESASGVTQRVAAPSRPRLLDRINEYGKG